MKKRIQLAVLICVCLMFIGCSANDKLSEENEKLIAENNKLTLENSTLSEENERLTSENNVLSEEKDQLITENEKLTSENSTLSKANENLTSENNMLSEEKDKLIVENSTLVEKSNDTLSEEELYTFLHNNLAKLNLTTHNGRKMKIVLRCTEEQIEGAKIHFNSINHTLDESLILPKIYTDSARSNSGEGTYQVRVSFSAGTDGPLVEPDLVGMQSVMKLKKYDEGWKFISFDREFDT